MRCELWQQAKEEDITLGSAAAWVTPTEHDLRVFAHDTVHPDHDKDFRTFAACPSRTWLTRW